MIEDFGIILRGKSLEKLPMISDKFDGCWLVNNFDNLEHVIGCLRGKNVVHYCNVLNTTVMSADFYRRFGITHVSLSRYSWTKDARQARSRFQKVGINHFSLLPEELRPFTRVFGRANDKHPSTGALAVIHAAHVLKPKHLWVCGLDFYEQDYLYRRKSTKPLEQQRKSIIEFQIPEKIFDVIRSHQDTKFHIASYCSSFPEICNLDVQ